MKPLEFLHSWTVEQFKAMKQTDVLEVKPSQTKQGTFFFTYGVNSDEVGAVTSKLHPNDITKPVISLVKGEANEKNPSGEFYMLHQKGEGVPTIMTL